MAELAAVYEQEFGVMPRFRAGLHAGPVIVSECGNAKRQLAYFGDTMNVAARLCEHSKTVEGALVVSAELLRAASIPADLAVASLGSVMLRGRIAPIEGHLVRRRTPSQECAAPPVAIGRRPIAERALSGGLRRLSWRRSWTASLRAGARPASAGSEAEEDRG